MKREKFTTITKLFLILFFAFSILFPIIKIFSNISIDAIKQLVVEQQFKESLINSITVTFIASIISFALAYVLAYAVNRSNIKFKKFFTIKIRENKIKIIFFVIKKYFITKEMLFVEQKRKKRKNKKN